MEFTWDSNDFNAEFYMFLHFVEVEKLQNNQLRKFSVSWNGIPLFEPISPRYLKATTVSNLKPLVAIFKTRDSTLPPILNAVEVYVISQLDSTQTFEKDGIFFF